MTNEEAIKILRKINCDVNCDNCIVGMECHKLDDALDIAIKAFKSQRWIPVSERLPEEDGFYLATCDGEICGEDEPVSSMAEFENGKWVDDEDDYQCVLAWMPLPQPYKESEVQ